MDRAPGGTSSRCILSGVTTDESACAVAHGDDTPEQAEAEVVAVFAGPVARHLTHFARHLGWRTAVVDPAGVPAELAAAVDVSGSALRPDLLQGRDVVVTDHHRPELGDVLRDALAAEPRWVGVLGSPRHEPPHVPALRALGVDDAEIARVHRPIGLDIGSRTPAEIALATLAGLVADRAGRPGGFYA